MMLETIRSRLKNQIVFDANMGLLLFLVILWFFALILRLINIDTIPLQRFETITALNLYTNMSNFTLLDWLLWPFMNFAPDSPYGLEWFIWPFVQITGYSQTIFVGRIFVIFVSTSTIPLLYFLKREMTPIGAATGGTILALSTILISVDRVWNNGSLVQTISVLHLVFLAWYIRSKDKKAIIGLILATFFGSLAHPDVFVLIYLSWVTALIVHLFFHTSFRNTTLFDFILQYFQEREISRSYVIGVTLVLATVIAVVVISGYLGARLSSFLSWINFTIDNTSFLYYFEYILAPQHVWSVILGILGIFGLFFLIQRDDVEQGLWFYTLCVFWFISVFLGLSAIEYKLPEYSQWFLVPLTLVGGVLGIIGSEYLPAIIESILNLFPKTPSWVTADLKTKVQVIFVFSIFVLSLLAVILAQIPGVTGFFPPDYRLETQRYILENIEDEKVLYQIGSLKHPWDWLFLDLDLSGRYVYHKDVDFVSNNTLRELLNSTQNVIILFSEVNHSHPIFAEFESYFSTVGTEKIIYSSYQIPEVSCKIYIIDTSLSPILSRKIP